MSISSKVVFISIPKSAQFTRIIYNFLTNIEGNMRECNSLWIIPMWDHADNQWEKKPGMVMQAKRTRGSHLRG